MTDMIMPTRAPTVPVGPRPQAGERSTGDGDGQLNRASGERDFLELLASLLPAGNPEELDPDGRGADAAIADALSELARMGDVEGGPAVGWPLPALLARFIDPDAAGTTSPGGVVPGAGGPGVAAVATSGETGDGTLPSAATAALAAVGDHADLSVSAAATGEAAALAGKPVAGQDEAAARGGITPAAVRAEAASRGDVVSQVAPARSTDASQPNVDVPTPATSATPSLDARVDARVDARLDGGLDGGLDGLRLAGPATADPASPDLEVVRTAPGRSFTSSAASVQRVLDAVEQLENAPPPRQLTLELGDHRLRVSIEDGQVRLSLLGQDDRDATRLVEEARAALEARGFDLGGEGRSHDGSPTDDRDRLDHLAGGPRRARPASRSTAAGLRL